MIIIHRIMSTSLLFLAFLYVGASAMAQVKDSENRDISLTVLNKKGRPVRNVVAQSLRTGKAGITDRSGSCVFGNMADDDTLSIRLTKNRRIAIPVTGMDSIVVKAVSAKFYAYFASRDDGNSSTVKIKRPLSPDDNTILDVQEILKKNSYSNLTDLLKGHASGINISTGTMNRGPSSISSGTQPIVVIDGVEVGTLEQANFIVNIYSIKTIEIQKNASGYGIRGANGVIVIKTQ